MTCRDLPQSLRPSKLIVLYRLTATPMALSIYNYKALGIGIDSELLTLKIYENRVYQLNAEYEKHYVAKFHRSQQS